MERLQGSFSNRSFLRRHAHDFAEHVVPRFAGQAVDVLEIGTAEGQCAVWLFTHVLTHHESTYIGIDHWAGRQDEFERCKSNLAKWRGKWSLVRGHSRYLLQHMPCWTGQHANDPDKGTVMPQFRQGMFDLVFIDGDHNAEPVKRDAELVLPMVKRGGWIIFADVRNRKPKKEHVADGVEWFLGEHGEHVRLAWSGRFNDCYEVL